MLGKTSKTVVVSKNPCVNRHCRNVNSAWVFNPKTTLTPSFKHWRCIGHHHFLLANPRVNRHGEHQMCICFNSFPANRQFQLVLLNEVTAWFHEYSLNDKIHQSISRRMCSVGMHMVFGRKKRISLALPPALVVIAFVGMSTTNESLVDYGFWQISESISIKYSLSLPMDHPFYCFKRSICIKIGYYTCHLGPQKQSILPCLARNA